jgi:SAM-dependent methyltransferase
MNLFRPALRDSFFDVVISNGVLHHTGNCRLAFQRVGRLVRPGGYLVIGLNSAFTRRLHDARRSLFHRTDVTGAGLEPRGTCHTLDEVLGWMEEDGIDFVNSMPKPRGGVELAHAEQLFAPRDSGNAVSRFASQLADMGSGYSENGTFIVIGRRPEEAS